MIAAQNLGVEYGGDPLFREVSFTINPGDRVGLVGSNGAGKTTLMRILVGERTPDYGEVIRRRSSEVGYLPQEGVVLSSRSVRDEVLTALGDLTGIEARLEELNNQISEAAENDPQKVSELLEELGELQHRYEAMNGFAAKGEVEKILMGLGFEPEDLDRSCAEFSGGWQMRIELAKLLLLEPDLLMLDEPTNHLDIESLTWLETFLRNYHGGILLISHDRAFLDALTTHTFEMTNRRLAVYTGNYSTYLREREKRRELQQSAYENQQKMIAETEKFIDRFRYKASKATQVQSRVKQLEKVERILPPEADEGKIFFRFPPAQRSGRDVVVMNNVTKRYGDNLVLSNVDFVLERGEKVAFLGRNGEGKSTFSRVIAGIEPFEGERTLGHQVTVGYFAQHQAEDLDPTQTVLATLEEVAEGEIRTQLRSLLGTFLFHGDDVFKPVSVLSGGEKSRLALAKLLLQPRNLLVLDEPTNHLDMASKNVLKQALIDFDGAIIVVSHDRDFLRDLVGKCVDFRNRGIKEYLGGIDEYLRRHRSESIDAVFQPTSSSQIAKDTDLRESGSDAKQNANRKEQKRREAELRNRRHAATRELKKSLQKIEADVFVLEERKGTCEQEMADPQLYENQEKATALRSDLTSIESRLADLYRQWEQKAAELQAIEAGFEDDSGE